MCARSCPTLCNPTRLLCTWYSPGKNTGVTCHFLRGSSRPRDRTHVFWVSCIADRFFTTEPTGKLTAIKTWVQTPASSLRVITTTVCQGLPGPLCIHQLSEPQHESISISHTWRLRLRGVLLPQIQVIMSSLNDSIVGFLFFSLRWARNLCCREIQNPQIEMWKKVNIVKSLSQSQHLKKT